MSSVFWYERLSDGISGTDKLTSRREREGGREREMPTGNDSSNLPS